MRVPIDDFACISLDAPTLPAYEVVEDSVHWVVWCKHCQAVTFASEQRRSARLR